MLPVAIGLTGGIGSGKSTAAAMFAAHHVPVLDLDQVGRAVVQPGSQGLAAIAREFGLDMLQEDGQLDRQKLARHCFSDSRETHRLNAILHPLIRDYEQDWLERQQASFVVIEASVLIESGEAARMRELIVILAEVGLRKARVLRRGMDETLFGNILARQCDDARRTSEADYCLFNNGSLAELQCQVDQLYQSLVGCYG